MSERDWLDALKDRVGAFLIGRMPDATATRYEAAYEAFASCCGEMKVCVGAVRDDEVDWLVADYLVSHRQRVVLAGRPPPPQPAQILASGGQNRG